MPYDVITVTARGAQAFAQLADSVQNHLTIEGCDSNATPLTASQAVQVSSRPSSPVSTTTHIVMSGVTNNHLLVYVQFIAGQTTGGQVNTFYLYGSLSSAPNDKFVIAVASDSRQTKLPGMNDIVNYVEVRFSLTFTEIQDPSTQLIVPSNSDYVLRSEFNNVNNNLNNWLVTRHSRSNASIGEDQDIKGNKTFTDSIISDIVKPVSYDTGTIGIQGKSYNKAYISDVVTQRISDSTGTITVYTQQTGDTNYYSRLRIASIIIHQVVEA